MKLDYHRKRAVTLHYLRGKSFDEVAAAMGISRLMAKHYVYTGVAKLRARLNGEE